TAAGALLVLAAFRRTRWLAAGLVLAGVLVAIWQGAALVAVALNGHGGSGQVRLLLWLSALHMIRDHPLLGIGPDQFLYYYDPHYTAHPYWIPRLNGHLTRAVYEPDLAHPHNLVLDLWLSGGVLGLGGFLLAVTWLARRTTHLARARMAAGARRMRLRVRMRGRESFAAAVAVGVLAGVVAGIVHGMVDSAYFEPDLALCFWWAVGVLALTGDTAKDF
ncbi:MAG: O-antigen ligase family protein, partial [Ktedonobacterales bacterium]